MTDLDHSVAITKPRIPVKPLQLSFALAMAVSSTLPTYVERVNVRHHDKFERHVYAATSDIDLDALACSSASTRPRAFTHQEAAQALAQLLAKEGFKPSRVEKTGDQSILFQFLGKTRACIDLYPSGELIVLVRKVNRDEIHELEYADTDRAIKLLQDAGVTS